MMRMDYRQLQNRIEGVGDVTVTSEGPDSSDAPNTEEDLGGAGEGKTLTAVDSELTTDLAATTTTVAPDGIKSTTAAGETTTVDGGTSVESTVGTETGEDTTASDVTGGSTIITESSQITTEGSQITTGGS